MLAVSRQLKKDVGWTDGNMYWAVLDSNPTFVR